MILDNQENEEDDLQGPHGVLQGEGGAKTLHPEI